MWAKTIVPTTVSAIDTLRGLAFWLIILGVILVCFLSGPFGTFDALPAGFRLIYWGLIVAITGTMSVWIHSLIRLRKWTSIPQITLISLIFGLIVVGIVGFLSLSLLSPINRYPGHLEIFQFSFPIATAIFFISVLLDISRTAKLVSTDYKRPDIIDRLEKYPHSKRVISLSAQDHYVEVTTEKGAELCLIRLADAIAEASPEDGFQIHRSHWVSKSAIERLERKGTSSHVILTDGRHLKVSQSRLNELEAYLSKVADEPLS